jgi:hypothetical protein
MKLLTTETSRKPSRSCFLMIKVVLQLLMLVSEV